MNLVVNIAKVELQFDRQPQLWIDDVTASPNPASTDEIVTIECTIRAPRCIEYISSEWCTWYPLNVNGLEAEVHITPQVMHPDPIIGCMTIDEITYDNGYAYFHCSYADIYSTPAIHTYYIEASVLYGTIEATGTSALSLIHI